MKLFVTMPRCFTIEVDWEFLMELSVFVPALLVLSLLSGCVIALVAQLAVEENRRG